MPATNPPPTGFLRLYHGTDLASAQDIINNGVSRARAAAWNASGEFWATTDPANADYFAMATLGVPARLEFDFPNDVLAALVGDTPPRAIWQVGVHVEFLPASFAALNRHSVNWVIVSPLP